VTYVEKIQIDLINNNRIYSVSTMALGAILLYFFIKPTVETPVYTLWIFMILAVDVFRLSVAFLYGMAKKNDQVNYDNAKLMILIGTILSGVCWGSVGFILMPVVEMQGVAIVMLVLVVLATGSTTTLSYQYHFSVIFVLLVLVSLMICLPEQKYVAGSSLLFLELVMVVLILFLLKNARVFYNGYAHMLELQVQSYEHDKEL